MPLTGDATTSLDLKVKLRGAERGSWNGVIGKPRHVRRVINADRNSPGTARRRATAGAAANLFGRCRLRVMDGFLNQLSIPRAEVLGEDAVLGREVEERGLLATPAIRHRPGLSFALDQSQRIEQTSVSSAIA